MGLRSVVVDGDVKVDLSGVTAHMGWVEVEGCSAEGKTLQRSPLAHTHSTCASAIVSYIVLEGWAQHAHTHSTTLLVCAYAELQLYCTPVQQSGEKITIVIGAENIHF